VGVVGGGRRVFEIELVVGERLLPVLEGSGGVLEVLEGSLEGLVVLRVGGRE
jgi:hypothetical protein